MRGCAVRGREAGDVQGFEHAYATEPPLRVTWLLHVRRISRRAAANHRFRSSRICRPRDDTNFGSRDD